jgi:TP901 family phage tail tape measure protein
MFFLDGGGASLGTAQGEITIDTSQAESSLSALGTALVSFDGKAGSIGQGMITFQQSTVGLAQGMQNVGRSVESLGQNVEAPFLSAISAATDLQSTMAGVNAVMDLSSEQFQQLGALAQQLGRDTVFSGEQSAQGIEQLGKAGISFTDIMSGAAAAATDLAAAGGVDVPKAADVMAAAMQAFNISGADSVTVADALAGAANASLSDINQLGIGLGQVAGVANAAGMSLQETTAFLAVMADNGVRGSDAATSMKNAILALLAPTDKASEAMANMGVSVKDSSGNFIGLAGASQQFFDAWKNSGQTMSEFLAPLNDILGRDAVRTILFGMQAIQDQQDGLTTGWGNYLDAVSQTGTAHEVAAKRMDSFAGSMEQLQGSLTVLAENIGTPIIEAIRPAVDALKSFVDEISALPSGILAAIGVVGAAAGAFTTLGGAVLVVGGYVLEAVARFQATGISLGEIVSIAGKVTLGLTALGLVAAAVALAIQTNFLGIRDGIQAVVDNIQALIDKIKLFTGINRSSQDSTGMFSTDIARNISAFGHALDEVLGTDISGFTDSIASMVDGLDLMGKRLAFASSFFAMFERDSNFIQPLSKKISALGKTIDSVFGTDVSGAFDAVAKGMDAFISLTHDSGWGAFPALVESIGVALDSVFGPNGASDALENFAFIAKHVETAWSTSIANGISPLAAALRAASVAAAEVGFGGLANALDNAATSAIQFGDNFKAAQEAIAGKGIVGLPNTILALNQAMEATLGIGLPDFLISAADAMAAFQTAFSNGIEQGLNPFEAAIKGVGAAIGDLFGGDVRNQFFAFVDATKQLGGAVQGLISSGFDRVGRMFSEIGTALSQGDIQGALAAVQSLISDVGTELQTAGQKAIDWAINVGEPALAGWAAEQAGNLGGWLKDKITGGIDLAGQALMDIEGWVINVGIPTFTGWFDSGGPNPNEGEGGGGPLGPLTTRIQELLPKAGEVLGNVEGWVINVGVPEIKEIAGDAGSFKDQVIKWVSDQITFPSVSELPDIHAKVQAFANDMGQNLAQFLADAMATIRSILFGSGGAGGTGGGLTNVAKGENAGLFNDVESNASDLAGTVVDAFLRGLASGFAEGVGQGNVATFISSGNFEPLKQQILSALGDFAKSIPGDVEKLVQNTKTELGNILAGLLDIESWLQESDAHGPVGLGGGPGQGLSRGAVNIQQPMEKAFADMVTAVKNAAAGLKDKILAVLPDPFAGIGPFLQGKASAAAQLISAATKTVTDSLNDIQIAINEVFGGSGGGGGGATDAAPIGKGVIDDVYGQTANGMTSEIPKQTATLQDQVGAAAKAAVDLTAPFLPIGPLLEDALSATGAEAAPAIENGFSPFIDGATAATTTQIRTVGSDIKDAAVAAAPGSVDGIGSSIDTAMSTAVDGITLTALAQAIGRKIGDAVVQGLAAASGGEAQAGLSAGTGASANIGTQISSALVTSIQGADFTAVGTAISTQIGTALSAGFSQAEAQGPSTAGIDIGSQIAIALASAITGSDFSVVSQAIQQKIGQALSGGQGGTQQTTDTAGAASEGATIGASIAATLANSILGSDFSVVGQAISQKISEAVSAATTGASAGLGGVAGQGGGAGSGIADGIVAGIVASFQSANYTPIGVAIANGISGAISSTGGNVQGTAATMLAEVIKTGMAAAESANEIGNVFDQAISGAIAASSGTIDIAGQAAMQTAVQTATGIASGAGPVGTAFTTAVGAGIGGGTGTVTGAVTAMVQAGVSAGQGAAAGASAVGDAFDTAAGGGIGAGAGTLTGAVTAMVGAAIDAGVGAAGGASAIGAAISSGAASGVIQSALEGPVADMVTRGIAAGLAAADAGSPSRKMIQQGEWLSEGMAIGITKGSAGTEKSMDNMVNKVIGRVEKIKPTITDLNNLGASFAGLPGLDEIGSSITSIASHIQDTVGSVRDSMHNIISGVRDALKQGKSQIASDATDTASTVTDSFAQVTKDRKKLFKDSLKDTKGGLLDLQSLDEDITGLRNAATEMSHGIGPDAQNFADQINSMADSLNQDQDSAIKAAVGMFEQINAALDKEKNTHRKKGRDNADEVVGGYTDGITAGTGAAVGATTDLTDQIINTFNANLKRLPEMADAIGKAIPASLADGMTSDLTPVNNAVGDVTNTVSGGIDKATPDIVNSATNTGTDFVTAVSDAINKQLGNVGSAAKGVADQLGTSFDASVQSANPAGTVNTFGQDIMAAINGLIGTIKGGGEQIGTAFTNGVSSAAPTGTGKSLTDQVKTGIESGVPAASNSAEGAGSDIGGSMVDGVNAACKPVNDQANSLMTDCIPSGITSGLGEATQSAKDAGQGISDALKGGMELRKHDVESSFKTAGSGFGSNLAQGITSRQTDAKNAVNATNATIGAIDASGQGKGVGSSFGAGIVNGINSQTKNVQDAAAALINAAKDAADAAAENHSPSKLFYEVGANMMLGLKQGIDDVAPQVLDSMSKTSQELTALFAGQGMAGATSTLNRNLGAYTDAIKDSLKGIEGVVSKSPFKDVVIPTDNTGKAKGFSNNSNIPTQTVDRSVKIGSLTATKGSPLEKAIFDVVDHLQATSGQYTVQ